MKLIKRGTYDSAPDDTLLDRINADIPDGCRDAQVVHHYDNVGHRWVYVYYWA